MSRSLLKMDEATFRKLYPAAVVVTAVSEQRAGSNVLICIELSSPGTIFFYCIRSPTLIWSGHEQLEATVNQPDIRVLVNA